MKQNTTADEKQLPKKRRKPYFPPMEKPRQVWPLETKQKKHTKEQS